MKSYMKKNPNVIQNLKCCRVEVSRDGLNAADSPGALEIEVVKEEEDKRAVFQAIDDDKDDEVRAAN